MVHRVDHGQQLPGALAVAQGGKRHRRPDRAVGVLPAVLAHARHVAADVAGIESRLVEGRIEQLDQRVVAAHQALVDRLHGQARALALSSAPGQHRPALRDRIDPAFGVARRTERRAVVEVGAAVPLAIPAVLLDVLAQAGRPRRGKSSAKAASPCARATLGELPEHFAQEEAQPDALALAAACRPGSCRRSSRRNRSAAGRARRSAGRAGWRARSARTGWPTSLERPGRS